MKYIYIVLIIVFTIGCTKRATTTQSESNYKKIAENAFNTSASEYIFNNNNDFVLAVHNENNENIPGKDILRFLIIYIQSDEVVVNNSIPNGKVKWISDYEIQIVSPPGMIKDSSETLDNYTEILNVKTGKQTKKSEAQF